MWSYLNKKRTKNVFLVFFLLLFLNYETFTRLARFSRKGEEEGVDTFLPGTAASGVSPSPKLCCWFAVMRIFSFRPRKLLRSLVNLENQIITLEIEIKIGTNEVPDSELHNTRTVGLIQFVPPFNHFLPLEAVEAACVALPAACFSPLRL